MAKKEREDWLEKRLTLLKAKEAAEYLRVSMFTLSRIEKEGYLVPFRTPGGHRRYSLRMLHKYLENSRRQNSKTDNTQRQQEAAAPDVERSQLEMAQA